MGYLVTGLILFCGMHLFPTLTNMRKLVIARIGEKSYMGMFALVSLAGIVLMVIGYRAFDVTQLFSPPEWGRTATAVLMLPSLVLFAAANMPGNIKRFTRHPMLWGLVLWSVAHLLSNGDRASVILFASLGVYGLLAMISANIRGATKQQSRFPVKKDILVVIAGVVAYVALVFLHPYLSGVALR
jgi:uncharacterized membrane protein